MNRIKLLVILLLSAVAVTGGVLVSCNAAGDAYQRVEGAVWNTTYKIIYKGKPGLADSIMIVMRDVEVSLSPFNKGSLISRVNCGETDSADVHISRVMDVSKRVNECSGGAFDPTLSPLINLWGFGYETTDSSSMPASEAIADALTRVGIDECDVVDGAVIKKHPGTTFNFSAVTKGYGCDMIGGMLERNGCTDYMVEIGGELALSGLNDRGKPWRVMIDAPDFAVNGHRGLTTIAITDCGIATSGNYRNYHESAIGRVGHTISAVTGYPVMASTLSATVTAPDCAVADALATACMAMEADSALAMIERWPSAECLIVTAMPGDTTLTVRSTPGFARK